MYNVVEKPMMNSVINQFKGNHILMSIKLIEYLLYYSYIYNILSNIIYNAMKAFCYLLRLKPYLMVMSLEKPVT